MKLKKLCRRLGTIFTAIFMLMTGLSAVAFQSEADLNQMLNTSSYKIVNTGDDENTAYYTKKTANIDTFMQEKLAVIEQTTDEGTVLLKNENGALPLTKSTKITLLGKACYNPVYGGSSGNAAIGNIGNTNINWTFKHGLENAEFQVNPSMWSFYATKNLSFSSMPSDEVDVAELPSTDLVEYSGAAIVVLSRVTGEGGDAANGYYELDAKELALVAKAETISDKVIVIINSPSALAIDALKNDANVDAILQVGGLGALGTKSIGKILNGTVNPSGKLVDIYAASSTSSAAYQSSGTASYANAAEITAAASSFGVGSGGTKYTVYNEGIYVGYKYYETRYEDCILGQGNASSSAGVYKSSAKWNYDEEVDYSFGYGLSYTQFKEEIQSFSVSNNVISMNVKVTNVDTMAGKKVVQLYAQSPYTDYDKQNNVEKSAIQLVDFAKTNILQPNASEVVSIKMDLYNILSYDYTTAKTWILDEGDYYFALGEDAHDALVNVLTAKNAAGISGDKALVKTWTNDKFDKFETYQFSESGFTTIDGLYHNNVDGTYTNQLDSANLNNLLGANTTKYLTRSDWSGTWPSGNGSVSASQEMIDRITFKSTYIAGEAVGDTYTYGANTSYNITMAIGKDYDDPIWDNILDQLMVEEMIATVGKNFGAIDPILGINFPGSSDNDGVGSGPCVNYSTSYDIGTTVINGVSKYSSIEPRMYPSETVEAATFNSNLVYKVGEVMCEDCFYTGMTSLWGPGLNLHRHPYAGRNFEYFSEDSMLTYIMGAEIVAGVQSNGVVCCPKHFAFNDQETDRYGFAVYTNEQAARENSLRAFEGSVAVGKAKNVMSSLNRIGCDWVGVSQTLQTNILRDEWDFEGYVITDNALEAYMCGTSVALGNNKLMLLPGNNRSAELNKTALLADVNLFEGVRESCHRILWTFANSKAMNGVSSSIKIVSITPWWKASLINIEIVLGSLTALCIVGFIADEKNDKKEEEAK